jgi:hypothetical protein
MGLFTRRAAPVNANTTTATGAPVTHDGTHNGTHNGIHNGTHNGVHDGTHPVAGHTGHEKGIGRQRQGGGMMGRFQGRNHGTYPDTLNSRPTFGQWAKGTWVDIMTMVIFGAIGLGVSCHNLVSFLICKSRSVRFNI